MSQKEAQRYAVVDPLPLGLVCNDTKLLADTVIHTDCVLFTWELLVKPHLRAGRLVDLGARLQPQLHRAMTNIDCAIVRLRFRSCSPAALHMIDHIKAFDAAPPD